MLVVKVTLVFFYIIPYVLGNTLRQFKHRRAVTDTCAVLDQEITASGSSLLVDNCVCASTAEAFLESPTSGGSAFLAPGSVAAVAALTSAIDDAPNRQTCTYPDNSIVPTTCSTSNPCDFDCTTGFAPYPAATPTSCVSTACDDGYVYSGNACVLTASHPGSKRGIKRGAQVCRNGLMACGVPGYNQWECLDTTTDLDSCGGCVFPPPSFIFSSLTTSQQSQISSGVDCSLIPHVADVKCLESKCVVTKCNRGFTVSQDNGDSDCIPQDLVDKNPQIVI